MEEVHLEFNNITSKLPGAISTENSFQIIDTHQNEMGHEADVYSEGISNYAKNFNIDQQNKIFVDDNGAVANAYSFSGLSQEEKVEMMEKILMDYNTKYPDYHFEILPGEFPLHVDGGYYWGNNIRERKPVMSTHVLYITDYKEHLDKQEKEPGQSHL